MPTLWSKTFERGATPVSIPGHDIVIKAERKRGDEQFLLGDPKSNTFDKHTFDGMAEYLAKYTVEMPFSPF